MELQVYLAPRFPKGAGRVSDPAWPTRSIVAGSHLGVPVAKMLLLPILQKTHIVRPGDSVQLWSFIDDTVARCEGHPTFVQPALSKVSQALVQGLREQ
eukprot:4380207-Pyramimonas_sp.AAC.1